MNLPIQALKNKLLMGLPPEDLAKLIEHLEPVILPKKQVLYEVGARLEDIYFIDEGLASVLTTMEDGASSEVGMVGPEGLIGVSALLGGETSAQYVVMQLPGRGHHIKATRCKKVFEESPGVRAVVLRFIEDLLNLSSQTAGYNRLHSVEQRSARWLLMASDRIGSNVLPLTQEFLAAMLGVRRSGVSEAMSELQRHGLIRYRRGQITIVDRKGLEEIACECYGLDKHRVERLLEVDRGALQAQAR
ncbi:MAG TPA: Crp/Fnr family transcriptional regulator [Stellaceae bacterium]|nr:Crp/Fnr family transcriptional regulator [Stellaceae bacterium]